MSRLEMSRLLRVAVVGAALVATGLGTAQQQLSPTAERGRALYHEHGCYGCHGFNGETGARDLVATNSPIIADVDTFVTFLRLRGDQAPLLPSTRMPSYPATALDDADARAIFAFVSTFELDAPAIEDIPAFRAILESAAKPYEP